MAIRDLVAVPWSDEALMEEHQAGVITWWTLSGEIHHETLKRAWAVAAFDPNHLPPAVSPVAALHRAMKAAAARERVIPLKGKSGYTILADVSTEEDPDVHRKQESWCSAWLEGGSVQWWFNPGWKPTLGNERTFRDWVEGRMLNNTMLLDTSDISSWISAYVWNFSPVRLRSAGGVYFIPHKFARDWHRFCEVMHSISTCTVEEVPAMRSPQAALAIIHALAEEIEQDAKKIEQDIASGIGKRALEARADRCQEMLSKLGTYEELVGARLEKLREAVEGLRAKVTEAKIIAEEEQ
jgi:hypothetical protein